MAARIDRQVIAFFPGMKATRKDFDAEIPGKFFLRIFCHRWQSSATYSKNKTINENHIHHLSHQRKP